MWNHRDLAHHVWVSKEKLAFPWVQSYVFLFKSQIPHLWAVRLNKDITFVCQWSSLWSSIWALGHPIGMHYLMELPRVCSYSIALASSQNRWAYPWTLAILLPQSGRSNSFLCKVMMVVLYIPVSKHVINYWWQNDRQKCWDLCFNFEAYSTAILPVKKHNNSKQQQKKP